MTPQQKSAAHLPLLYNPFLNCIFNNPYYNKAPFKQTIEELARNHNDFTILVPPAHVLHHCYDPATELSSHKVLLRELCYNNEEFIRSHIIRTGTSYSSTITPISKVQLVIYNTMSGKQVLFKNGMVFMGKGFKRSLKLNVLLFQYFSSFCDYFPKGSKFMILYVEDCLIGSFDPHQHLSRIPQDDETSSQRSVSQQEVQDSITFEKLLRSFPLLSKAVSERFYRLFHHNNHQFRVLRINTRKKLEHIRIEFHSMLDEAYKIIQDSIKVENPDSEQTYNIINHILSIYPGLDLNRLVHDYVELNLYDKLWAQLLFQYNYPNDDKQSYDPEAVKFLTAETYNRLSCLALNQLDIPIFKPWQINTLQEKVALAIEEFSKLADSSIVNLTAKTKIIINTVNILSDLKSGSDFVMDADVLIGLLIMVIVHSKIDNLEAHLYYIKNFSAIDYSGDGHFNYIMSNLDAVLFHLSSSLSDELSDLIVHSQQNFEFWSAIQQGDVDAAKTMLDEVHENYVGKEIPSSHYLKSKNINGESCIMFAIKAKNFSIYDMLINEHPNWFSIDELLFDKNIITNQNLVMVALADECPEIATDLVNVILSSATKEEQVAYFNSVDNAGRSVGHYLFHNYKLMGILGDIIDWELKDLNSHTPLFSICRCYDHPNYPTLISEAFACVYQKYGGENINFDKHIDKSGNTLLHIILKNIPESQLLSRKENLISVNQQSSKYMTPLTLYVKYYRLENLKDLLQDNRLDFLLEDSKNCYNVFDYFGFLSMKSTIPNETFKKIESLIFGFYIDNFLPKVDCKKLFSLNAKYDQNKRDWFIFFRDSDGISNHKSLEMLKQIIYFIKLDNPCTYLPDKDVVWLNYGLGSTTPYFHKYRINRLIDTLNLFFTGLLYRNGNCYFERFLETGRDRERLTLDFIQEASLRQEKKRANLGVVKLKSSQIDEIEFFLTFAISDLYKYKDALHKFGKLSAIADMKQTDIRTVYLSALKKLVDREGNYTDELKLKVPVEAEIQDSCWGGFHSYVFWLQISLDELLKSVNKILEEIRTWKELYSSIRELNSELHQIEEKSPSNNVPENLNSNNNSNGNPTANGVPTANSQQENGGSLSRRSTFSIEPIPELDFEDDTTSAFFNFSNIIESKKARYKKLLMTKSEKVKQIMKLNVDIKWEHEVVASEISSFLKFRCDFLRFGVKTYVNSETKRIRNNSIELRKLLRDVKNNGKSYRK